MQGSSKYKYNKGKPRRTEIIRKLEGIVEKLVDEVSSMTSFNILLHFFLLII